MIKDKIAESDKPEIHVRVSGLSASVFHTGFSGLPMYF